MVPLGGTGSRDRRVALAACALLLGATAEGRGQALPLHTATGVTAGFQENAARIFVSALGRGTELATGGRDPLGREIDVIGVAAGVIPFSMTPFWTTRVVLSYLDKSMEFSGPEGSRLAFETAGLGDAVIDTKWIFLRDNRPAATSRLGVQAGVKLPLGGTHARLPSGDRAPRRLQLGTGSWDFPLRVVFTNVERRWGFHGNLGYRFNTEDEGFEAGDVLRYDLAIGFRALPARYRSLTDQTLVAYLELNGQVVAEDATEGRKDLDTGGHLLALSPALQWIASPWLLFEAGVQLPVLQDLNGDQLEHEPRFQLGSRLRFSVFR